MSWLAGWTKQTISMATLQRDPAQGEEFRLWPSVSGADARIAHAHRSLQSELSRMDLTEQACYTYSLVVVPLYDTLGPDACAFIINQAEINLVVVENDTKCNLLLDKAPRCLRKLVVIKETRQTTNQRAKNRGVELLKFDDVERLAPRRITRKFPPNRPICAPYPTHLGPRVTRRG